jgi:glycosyltransferase involved in cell wall biosynthesis
VVSTAVRSTLILLSAWPDPDLRARVEMGEHPQLEYLQLADAIDGEVLDLSSVSTSTLPGVRAIGRRLGPLYGLAWLGFLLRRRFDQIYITSEDLGIRLCPLLRAAGWLGRVTLVVHCATPRRRKLLRLAGHRVFRDVVCLASEQFRVLTDEVGIPAHKVHREWIWIDHHFYSPRERPLGDYALSIGAEGRDYPTLDAAAVNLPYRFHVVASGWSPEVRFSPTSGVRHTSNVTVGRGYTHVEVRELYAGARFVVVPLRDLPYGAGVMSIGEAMAMGKAVVTTRSSGILDYVEDGVTGRVVPVGDPDALAEAITDLWENPERAERMGRHNRQRVERLINTDRYVDRVRRRMTCGMLEDV